MGDDSLKPSANQKVLVDPSGGSSQRRRRRSCTRPIWRMVLAVALSLAIVTQNVAQLSRYLAEIAGHTAAAAATTAAGLSKIGIELLPQHEIQKGVYLPIIANESELWTSRWMRTQGTVPAGGSKNNNSTMTTATSSSLSSPFCLTWNTNSDEWWTHHVDWEVFHEDDTHYCFRKIPNPEKAKLYRDMYNIQFRSPNCSSDNVWTKKMWSSGWGADFANVVDGLIHSHVTRRPFQLAHGFPWHYAALKPPNASLATCPSQDMFCYFLQFSVCQPSPNFYKEPFWTKVGPQTKILAQEEPYRWYLEYATRPQTWLRKEVYDFVHRQLTHNIHGPCTVMHVRRGDIVLHDNYSRRYHAIAEYIDAAATTTLAGEEKRTTIIEKNILILTDDQNAVGEALTEFPQYNWMYLNRTRFRASEGGWERQIPSGNPAQEVITILSTFRLVRQCNSILHSQGNFGNFLYGEILVANKSAWAINIDEIDGGGHHHVVYNANNSKTVAISKKFDRK